MSKKDWQLLKAYQATGLTPEEVEGVKRERNALMKYLHQSTDCCEFCVHQHFNQEYCMTVNFICGECACACPCKDCDSGSHFKNWQWRGVKEDGK